MEPLLMFLIEALFQLFTMQLKFKVSKLLLIQLLLALTKLFNPKRLLFFMLKKIRLKLNLHLTLLLLNKMVLKLQLLLLKPLKSMHQIISIRHMLSYKLQQTL
jgi:hypothetical protein